MLPVTYMYTNTMSFGFLIHLSNKRTLDHCPIHVLWLLLGHKLKIHVHITVYRFMFNKFLQLVNLSTARGGGGGMQHSLIGFEQNARLFQKVYCIRIIIV